MTDHLQGIPLPPPENIEEQIRREDQKMFMEKLQNPISKERMLWTLDMMKARMT